MEESAKRRERLKAMRMEASQAGNYNEVDDSTMSLGLSNPLVETSKTLVQLGQPAAPRFDYYTDPMAAFSSDKRRSAVGNQNSSQNIGPPTRPRNPEMTPSPAYQAPTNYSPDQRMYQARNPHHSAPYRSPMVSPSPAYQAQTNYSPDQIMYQAQSPYQSSGPYRSPMGMARPFDGHQSTPGVWNGSGGTPNYGFPNSSPRGGNFPSTRLGPGGSPSFYSGQGRGNFSNSPSPGSGRRDCSSPNTAYTGKGKGPWLGRGMSPGSGRSGGRGLRSRDNVSAELRPNLYYNKSMVEDPWEFLKPVPWKSESTVVSSLYTPDSQKSWLPKSISMKKPRVSEPANYHSSQPSLAEYLAASFNEVVDNKPNTDEPQV